jgi:hypothetical protein
MKDMECISEMRPKAVQLIRDYLGDVTAESYASFYANEDDQVIIDSIRELLKEYIGEERVEEVMIRYGLLK